MEIKRDKTIICNYICSVLMILLIVLQFIPYWNYGGQSSVIYDKPYHSKEGQSVSINSYVWGNPENTDLMLYFSEKFDEHIRVEEGDTEIKIPLEAINEKYGKSGIYVKNGDTIKYKVVEILSKDGKSATIKVDKSESNGLLLDDEVVIVYDEENLDEYIPADKEDVGFEIPLEAINGSDEESGVYILTYAGVEILSSDTTHAIVKIDDVKSDGLISDKEMIVIHDEEKPNVSTPVEKETAAIKIPLEAIHEKDGISGVYVKDEDTVKYKIVEVLSKDSESAIVEIDNSEKNRLIPNDEVIIPYDEVKLGEEFKHYLDVIGGISCWQITIALVGIGFCLIKRKSGIYALFPLVNGILGAFGYWTSAELQLCSWWILPFIVNVLMAVAALITVFFWIRKLIRK